MIQDEILAGQAKMGSREAFEELVRRYGALVYYVVLQMVADPHEAEDVTQEVFVSAFNAIGSFDSRKASFKTWLFSIVRRRSIDWLRQSKRIPKVDAASMVGAEDSASQRVEDTANSYELKEVLKNALAMLPEEQRLCLALQSLQGFSYKEIAKIMGIPIGTVRSRIASARKKLLEHLSDNSRDDIECNNVTT